MVNLNEMGCRAVAVKPQLQMLSTEEKNRALIACAKALVNHEEEIIRANGLDLEKAVANGMSEGLQDRLRLTEARIAAMAEGLEQVAELPDCLGDYPAQRYGDQQGSRAHRGHRYHL